MALQLGERILLSLRIFSFLFSLYFLLLLNIYAYIINYYNFYFQMPFLFSEYLFCKHPVLVSWGAICSRLSLRFYGLSRVFFCSELPLLPASFFLMLVLSLTFLWEAFLGCLVHLECLSIFKNKALTNRRQDRVDQWESRWDNRAETRVFPCQTSECSTGGSFLLGWFLSLIPLVKSPPDFNLGHTSQAVSVLEAESTWERGSTRGDGLPFQ